MLTLLCLTIQATAAPIDFYSAFPGVGILTSFAHDYGDMFDSVTYEGERYDDVSLATKELLPKFGWDKPEERLRLGTAWADEVVFFGSEVVASGAGRRVELLPDGTFFYTTWTISMRGRSPGSSSTRWQVEITPDARLRVTELERSGRPY